MAASIHTFETVQAEDALILVAFPTTGSVASIAGHYLVDKLDLPLVGSIHMDAAPPVTAVRQGLATSPVRIFGGEVECTLPRGECPRLYVVVCDVPIHPDAMAVLAGTILELAAGAKMVLCLDGIVRADDDETPVVYRLAARTEILEDLKLNGVKRLENGLIGGVTGELLLQAGRGGQPVGGLVVEALKDFPDGRAAAALIAAVDELTPLVEMDAKPLLEEAMKLEQHLRQARDQAMAVSDPSPGLRSFV